MAKKPNIQSEKKKKKFNEIIVCVCNVFLVSSKNIERNKTKFSKQNKTTNILITQKLLSKRIIIFYRIITSCVVMAMMIVFPFSIKHKKVLRWMQKPHTHYPPPHSQVLYKNIHSASKHLWFEFLVLVVVVGSDSIVIVCLFGRKKTWKTENRKNILLGYTTHKHTRNNNNNNRDTPDPTSETQTHGNRIFVRYVVFKE